MHNHPLTVLHCLRTASHAQYTLTVLHCLRTGEVLLHLEVGVRLEGRVPNHVLQAALDALTFRHEALRTRMMWQNPSSGLHQALVAPKPGLLKLQVRETRPPSVCHPLWIQPMHFALHTSGWEGNAKVPSTIDSEQKAVRCQSSPTSALFLFSIQRMSKHFLPRAANLPQHDVCSQLDDDFCMKGRQHTVVEVAYSSAR